MYLKVMKSETGGIVHIPGSKSHTIRALFIAGLAGGVSEILNPLISSDALSAVEVCKALGAEIQAFDGKFTVKGFNGVPNTPSDVINTGNSGTTINFAASAAALGEGCTVFTGDGQIRSRPMGPLLEALNNLGAQAFSTRGTGVPPIVIKGRLKGGYTGLDGITSQYLSSLLLSLPMCLKDSEIALTRLYEVPYAEITLWWLDKQGIKYQNNGFKTISIQGGQSYKPFKTSIPGDFSSATFFMVLAAISGGEFVLKNLDMTDPQGDKLVLSILRDMGARVDIASDYIVIKGNGLKGREIDMNSIPDALPAMAVAACFAQGETRLVNVPQARLKETDRIHVMCTELSKMGADITELADGLVVRESRLKGCRVSGHCDHRVVMALSVAGLNIEGETVIDTAEAVNVTFPEFIKYMNTCKASMRLMED
ncbi:3-phosphoshikimate 1-carboxyvinyltransferase [Anaerobacterium chartisolvens]|uniref:3-phosphoshikimate 1-carboxyvinyltransferase n=1 Tax=Anaerobacterium chartisolvens TaxID=1297424 RepID=A0A369B5M8_9FIRM|nr:3-phosphoshikimate 1-carboxyvinyltransferase [Anaerobacterium chartisolvens]RCX16625.1 3-phosphoshikimate 1-carboxyvinyltransferase [Anaerobacterium chartisolvens]